MKIFKKINKAIYFAINIVTRFLLCFAYFVVFLPMCIYIRLFTDFLCMKKYDKPNWIIRNELKDVTQFLRQQ